MELWMTRLWFFPFSNDGREKRMFEVVRKRIYKMYLCILRDFSLEKISCKNTTTFSLKQTQRCHPSSLMKIFKSLLLIQCFGRGTLIARVIAKAMLD